jgi:polysaccharide export outer membrane protein
MGFKQRLRPAVLWIMAGVCAVGTGCVLSGCLTTHGCPGCSEDNLPKELRKVNMPDYVIEPPDILEIDALRVVPKPPYHIAPFDALLIRVTNTKPDEPIANVYVVDPDGRVELGMSYGSVLVLDLTISQARDAIQKHLEKILNNPVVSVSLARSRGLQQIRGEHLVRPNGTISLGIYGDIYVAGMTLTEAKQAIELQLSAYLSKPEIVVDVTGYNSKVYYLIFDLAGVGEQVIRLPITGNETVLDAVSQSFFPGLPPITNRDTIWIARPAPADSPCDQILPVDWRAITRGGSTRTNYQLLPGDRLFVKSDPLIRLDNFLAKIYAPIERSFGVILLGTDTVNTLQGRGSGGGGTGGAGIR